MLEGKGERWEKAGRRVEVGNYVMNSEWDNVMTALRIFNSAWGSPSPTIIYRFSSPRHPFYTRSITRIY